MAAEPTTTPTATAMLETRSLVSGYGRMQTLHGVDVTVPPKGVTVIIGPNGSGKSTLLKTIMGLVKPWSGEVRLDGKNIAGMPTWSLVRLGMCMVPQGRVVFPMLTVEENLRMSAFSVRDRSTVEQRLQQTYEFLPLLGDRRRQMASSLSGGEQVMLSLAKVVMLRPKLLLLDEPSLGLSPKLVNVVYEKISALANDGLPTMLVEQNVRKGLSVANHVIVLTLGKVRFEGLPERL